MTPTPPNLIDYLAFLYGDVGVDPNNLVTASGTATDGNALSLIDSSQAWNDNQWIGYYCLDTTQDVSALIADSDSISVTFAAPLENSVLAGDDYVLAPRLVNASFQVALSTVNDIICLLVPDLYTWAAYNLATHTLLSMIQDMPGQTYWRDQREFYNLSTARLGVVASSSSDSSSTSYLNPDQFKRLTIGDLQLMKTPWGREYLGIAQNVGDTAFGIS